MRILHLLSNFRWTERAEPAADLVLGQQAIGLDARLACGKSRAKLEDSIEFQARQKGLEPVVFEMPKHFRVGATWNDVRAIRNYLAQHPVDVLHSHMLNAHLMAVLIAARMKQPPLVVHSMYEPSLARRSLRTRWICRPRTDGWILIGDQARNELEEAYGVPAWRMLVSTPPVDVKRFQTKPDTDPREIFGIPPNAFVVGLVMRMGVNRGVDLFLKALRLIKEDCPELRGLLIGRGEMDEAVHQPAAELGVSDRLIIGGYCRWEKLVAAYKAMDVFAYVAPGTDKSCRAVREALSAGVPVTAVRVGYLPELVDEGRTGRLCEPTPEAMAETLKSLYDDRASCRAMAKQAEAQSRERFSPDGQATRVAEFYEALRRSAT